MPVRKGLEYRNKALNEEASNFRVILQPADNNIEDIQEEVSHFAKAGIDFAEAGPDSINTAPIITSQETLAENSAHIRGDPMEIGHYEPDRDEPDTNDAIVVRTNTPEPITNTMPTDFTKMPTPGSKRSPLWDGDARELNDFFDDFEELSRGANLSAAEKVKWVLKYVDGKKYVKFWKTREGYEEGD